MAKLNIQRDAKVYAADGECGEVKHVILDHQTREVTDLVVEADGNEYLVPMDMVTDVAGDRVRIGGSRAEFMARRFDHDRFDTVDEDRARKESAGEATHGGAPLLDARNDAVEVGAGGASADWASRHADYRLQPSRTNVAVDESMPPAAPGFTPAPPANLTPEYRPDGPTPADDPTWMRTPRS